MVNLLSLPGDYDRILVKELKTDLNIQAPDHGGLNKWANQGVLLLNTSLTVEHNKPQSHAKIGWTQFTDNIIRALNNYPDPLVFLLWGSHAQSKHALILCTRQNFN